MENPIIPLTPPRSHPAAQPFKEHPNWLQRGLMCPLVSGLLEEGRAPPSVQAGVTGAGPGVRTEPTVLCCTSGLGTVWCTAEAQ
jgi:hypothetical protein